MSDDCTKKRRKYWLLALFALFIGLIGLTLPEDSINYTNITLAGGNWTIDSNFTNLYPVERNLGITYWNNKTSPIILDFSFANMTDAVILNYTLWINDTVSERTVTLFGFGGSFQHFIPQGARYNITNITSGSTPIIYWYEHNIIMEPSIVNNYYNTTGSGGVSFNGTPVNLNGSYLYNGSISHSNLTNLSWSVANHTIDSDVEFNRKMLKNVSKFWGNDGVQIETQTANNAIVLLNNTRAPFPVAMRQNSLGYMSMITNWNTTSDTRFNSSYPVWIFRMRYNNYEEDDFQVVRSSDGLSFTLLFSIDKNGTLTMSNYSGTGNAFTRIDSTGKLYRDEIEGYTGGNQYLCINSSAGVYAKTSTCT